MKDIKQNFTGFLIPRLSDRLQIVSETLKSAPKA